MIQLDGSAGEGGGQILRTALALSLLTGEPFTIDALRGGRARPGLLRQHLTAVRAAAAVGDAEVDGDALGSTRLRFRPRALRAVALRCPVGSAGSTGLVLQTVAPALLHAGGISTLEMEGGTHAPAAPSHPFLAEAWAPWFDAVGGGARGELERPGFAPAGGGRCRWTLEPLRGPAPLIEVGPCASPPALRADVVFRELPRRVAADERRVLLDLLGARGLSEVRVHQSRDGVGPGNVVTVRADGGGAPGAPASARALHVAFGEVGRPAEQVAAELGAAVSGWLDSGAWVDVHLADQLLLLLAVGGGGRFCTPAPSGHTRTQAELVARFLGGGVALRPDGPRWWVEVDPARALGARGPIAGARAPARPG